MNVRTPPHFVAPAVVSVFAVLSVAFILWGKVDIASTLVVLVSIAGIFMVRRYPHFSCCLFVFLYLVLSYEREVRNVITILGAIAVTGFLAYMSRIRWAIAYGVVFFAISVTEIFEGIFVPESIENVLFTLIMFISTIGIGSYLHKAERKSREEKLRAEEAKKRQRKILIKTLHDSVARSLTSAVMRAEGISFGPGIPEDKKEELELIAEESRRAIEEVRTLIRLLDEDELELPAVKTNLADQIGYFVNLLESHGFNVTVVKDDSIFARAYKLEPLSLPVMPELASNVLKYGASDSEVLVKVERCDEDIVVTVTNKIAATRSTSYLSTGIGLAQIREEITREGGSFESVSKGELWVTTWEFPVR
ncbi:MAG: histidine kinase [Corynebacterium sp.]|uniref:sensor histidine kinase n=1 Tax=Corynebacterium sp. TaxID=1720 RepID=UPI0026DDAAB4|nr:histidine kinase [Corynebacterium sp.]MDO5098781.1 histidine kinase [Corynebacterium sp.]